MDELIRLAELVAEHNDVTARIAGIIGRPAEAGHIGEFIASRIFHVDLLPSASHKSIDGHFCDPPLAGRSVNIKWYRKLEGLLDITPAFLPEYYLVIAGPRAAAASSRGSTRPLVVESAFLFDAAALHEKLQARDVRIGIATSVANQFWLEAEVYPTPRSTILVLTDEQRLLLSLFRGQTNVIASTELAAFAPNEKPLA